MHALRLELVRPAAGRRSATVFESVDQPRARPGARRPRCASAPTATRSSWSSSRGWRGSAASRRAADELPTAVTEVLNRRLLRLPEQHRDRAARRRGDRPRRSTPRRWRRSPGSTRTTCSTWSSRRRPPGWCARTASTSTCFAHALVRDTLRAGMSASRRARAARPGRGGARPACPAARPRWRGTGTRPGRRTPTAPGAPPSTPRRWPAGYYAYDQAAELLRGALVSIDGDAQADAARPVRRADGADRGATAGPPSCPTWCATVEEAIEVGKQLRDPEAVARAAIATTQGVLWRSGAARRGSTSRWSPRCAAAWTGCRPRTATCAAGRCWRSPTSSTTALSYEERRALCDEGAGDGPAARRPAAGAWTPARSSSWRCGCRGPRRSGSSWSPRRCELARATGQRAQLRGLGLPAGRGAQRARPAGRDVRGRRRRARARPSGCGSRSARPCSTGIVVPWLAMAGRFDECDRVIEHLRAAGRPDLAHQRRRVRAQLAARDAAVAGPARSRWSRSC